MTTRLAALAGILAFSVAGTGCARVQAMAKLKDGNKEYKSENFKKAIEAYQRAVELEPGMAEGWFYLGSSQQALYRPGKPDADNKARLDEAIKAYNKALEVNDGSTERLKTVKQHTLGALTGIYSDEPYRDFDKAYAYAQQLVQENPNDAKNLYAMANLFEKFEKVTEAEQTYRKVAETNPNDPKACGALAAFLNKPLWDGKSKFDEAIQVLQRCSELTPNDPGGYQKVATFYWDKAYRDPSITDEQKTKYADLGLENVDKALQIKPDYFEAVIFKGLLYRVKASVEQNPRVRQQYLEQAALLQKQGMDIKKQQMAEAANQGPLALPASPAPGQ